MANINKKTITKKEAKEKEPDFDVVEETLEPVEEVAEQPEAPAKPKRFFVKKSYRDGVCIDGCVNSLYAGEEIKDLGLAYKMIGLGIELTHDLEDCLF